MKVWGSMSGPRIATLVVLLGLAALMGLLGYRMASPGTATVRAGAPGINAIGRAVDVERRPAPDILLRTFDGEQIWLSDLRGRIVVLNFWSSWCPPCEEEAPVLESVWRRYQARDVALVSANVWDAEQAVRNFLADYEITHPSGTSEGALAAEYGLTGIPETFVIDAEGMLASRWFGPLTDAQLSTVIDEVLEDGGRAAEGTP